MYAQSSSYSTGIRELSEVKEVTSCIVQAVLILINPRCMCEGYTVVVCLCVCLSVYLYVIPSLLLQYMYVPRL